ncbi:MAG: hypothetical protein LBB81_10890 [Treponema sp.]|jgi:hypothetical protein|nr:hypothetical protein [Treponema sp.]
MKNTAKWLAVLVLAAVTGFSVITCDNGTTSGSPPPAGGKITFKSGKYELDLFKNAGRAAYIPAVGDRYEIRDNGKVISRGSITYISADGTLFFKPDSGKDPFTGTISDDKAQITSTITLDDGTELTGLSLYNDDSVNKLVVYTSYKEAVDAGFLYHNGNIGNKNFPDTIEGSIERQKAIYTLMNTLDYTLIKIDSNLPLYGLYMPDWVFFENELNLQDNDYYKWDIEYNDHRILLFHYYLTSGERSVGEFKWTLVNEEMLNPVIDGKDYSAGTIKHGDETDYGVYSNAIYNNSDYDEFTVAGKAPVINLGLLKCGEIIYAVGKTRGINYRAGDYFKWEITYSDSKWRLAIMIREVREVREYMSYTMSGELYFLSEGIFIRPSINSLSVRVSRERSKNTVVYDTYSFNYGEKPEEYRQITKNR